MFVIVMENKQWNFFFRFSVKTENVNDEALNIGCGSDGDCLSTPVDCDSKCGCDEYVIYFN